MPITIPTISTKLFDDSQSKVKFAIAQPPVTTISLLYGVEVSAPSGFTDDPQLDIHVFNNPRAAEDFVKTLVSDFSFKDKGLSMPDVLYDKTLTGLYYVTAQRAVYHEEVPNAPVGISGCSYSDHAKPFITNTASDFSLPTAGSFLNVVAVINNTSAIDDDDETVLIKTITESASK